MKRTYEEVQNFLLFGDCGNLQAITHPSWPGFKPAKKEKLIQQAMDAAWAILKSDSPSFEKVLKVFQKFYKKVDKVDDDRMVDVLAELYDGAITILCLMGVPTPDPDEIPGFDDWDYEYQLVERELVDTPANAVSSFPLTERREQQETVEKIKEITGSLEEILLTTRVAPPFYQEAIDELQKALWALENALEIIE